MAAPSQVAEKEGYPDEGKDTVAKGSKKELRKRKAEKRHLVSTELKPVRELLSGLEEKIAFLEEKEKEIEIILADPVIFKDKEKSVPLLGEYNRNKRRTGRIDA